MPKISLIMAVYNKEKYLQQAVESVFNQTFTDFEFIIVDDRAMSDVRCQMSNVQNKYKKSKIDIKIIQNKQNLGLTKSLNKAIKISRGKYITRMDADDISLPHRLQEQFEFMEKNPEIALCGAWVNLIDKNNKKIGQKKLPTNNQEIKKVILRYNPFIHPSLMIRKKVLDKVGFYDETFSYSQDYELVLRIGEKYQLANLSKVLMDYRVNIPSSISLRKIRSQQWHALRARWKALRQYHYPQWQIIYLIKPAISFLIPQWLKIIIYKRFFWK